MEYFDNKGKKKELVCDICDSENVTVDKDQIEMFGDSVIPVSICDNCGANTILYDWDEGYEVVE